MRYLFLSITRGLVSPRMGRSARGISHNLSNIHKSVADNSPTAHRTTRNNKMDCKTLVAFDFDHTLIHGNSDIHVKKLLPNKTLPANIEKLYRKDNWTEYMGAIFKILHESGVNQCQILECMKEMPFVEGMPKLLGELRKPSYEVIIISDSNSEFIKCIMEASGLEDVVHTTYTNPAYFDASGRLCINYYHEQDWCKLSSKNLCKGHILENHVAEAKKSSRADFSKVLYVGDGHNDLCPSLRLKANDVTYPRKDHNLIKEINKLSEDALKCNVVPWENGHDILKHISSLLTK